MPNHVDNNLTIICEDDKTMDKIRTMIFDKDEKNNRIFTMERMLPRPPEFSDTKGYDVYGYDWSSAIWGTKWDVYNFHITESGNTINISYQTAWNPNVRWVTALCYYIQKTLNYFDKEQPYISVKLTYTDFMGDFGGLFDWVPFKNPFAKRYSLLEYARLHDKILYKSVSEYHELRSSVGSTIDNEALDEFCKNLPF